VTRTIYLTNQSTIVTSSQFAAAANAIYSQVWWQLCPAWGLAIPQLIISTAPPANAEIIRLLDTTTDASALGYHTVNGAYPQGFAFAKTALADGVPWSEVLDHEVCEQIIDPWCVSCVLANYNGLQVAMALESNDPCESDSYSIFGVPVSNFVLPAWFTGQPGRYDWLGKLKAPLTIDAGGYMSYLPFAAGAAWQSVMGQDHNLAAHGPYSRFQRRRATTMSPLQMRRPA
jgi:hypothetical protein